MNMCCVPFQPSFVSGKEKVYFSSVSFLSRSLSSFFFFCSFLFFFLSFVFDSSLKPPREEKKSSSSGERWK